MLSCSYGYLPAYQQFKDSVKIVHFIGADKPWDGIPPGEQRPKAAPALLLSLKRAPPRAARAGEAQTSLAFLATD